ncbi:MAG: 30S ribosomal protein S18 [Planctomycetota bacterium]|nr:30S ribosomal protein S18 [Planctomycetota bacterium]
MSASGKSYIDYKDTESLRKMVSGNGKLLSRKRTGADAMEQRMIARAVKRARYIGLLPYVSASM